MKTKNIILLGVVGVGAVGAYMFMKRKQSQNAMLQQQAIDMANLQSVNTTATTSVPTADLAIGLSTDGISLTQKTLDLENAQRIVSDIGWLLPRANKGIGQKYLTELNQKYADLEKLGFRYDQKTYMLREGKYVQGVFPFTQKPATVWQYSNTINPLLDLINAKKLLSNIEWEKANGYGGGQKVKDYTAQIAKLGYKLDAKNQLIKI
jgi:hypothetical protein